MNNKLYKWLRIDLPIGYFTGLVTFIGVISIALYYGNYYVLLLSIVPLLFYFSIFEFDKIYYFIVFTTPLSVGLQWLMPQMIFDLSVPSEALMILLLIILVLKGIKSNDFKLQIFTHPISIVILVYLFWMLITSITSSMPIVSFKHLAAQIWFVVSLYFFPLLLFRRQNRIFTFYALYIVSFSFIIIYSINKHLEFGLFDKNAAHFVMQPFYNDHTSYGAVIAMYIPVIAGLLFLTRRKPIIKYILFVIFVLFIAALVLSYTRAAWISVAAAAILFLLILLRIKIKYLVLLGGLSVLVLFIYRVEIIDKLDKNKQDSSVELSEHIRSMSNIATDASNLERINRWNSALKMFYERPVFGWGPGTYMFQYAPFQMSGDKTIISTNFAEGGNAHSEYIGPLAEQGVIGLIAILLIIFIAIYRGFKLYYESFDLQTKLLVLISLLSLSTYFIHGLLNNYLDTDKASVPFWGMMAIIASLDLYAVENKDPQLGGAEER